MAKSKEGRRTRHLRRVHSGWTMVSVSFAYFTFLSFCFFNARLFLSGMIVSSISYLKLINLTLLTFVVLWLVLNQKAKQFTFCLDICYVCGDYWLINWLDVLCCLFFRTICRCLLVIGYSRPKAISWVKNCPYIYRI